MVLVPSNETTKATTTDKGEQGDHDGGPPLPTLVVAQAEARHALPSRKQACAWRIRQAQRRPPAYPLCELVVPRDRPVALTIDEGFGLVCPLPVPIRQIPYQIPRADIRTTIDQGHWHPRAVPRGLEEFTLRDQHGRGPRSRSTVCRQCGVVLDPEMSHAAAPPGDPPRRG